MKKTILEWYDHLPEPIRSEAIKNYDGTEGLYDTLAEAIWIGSTWSDTTEGCYYWKSIWGRAENGEFDTPIESELVSFGNYLLSDERKEAISELNQQTVTHADIENWKLLKGTK